MQHRNKAKDAGLVLLVGLANPGKEYAQTRHNAGAWFINQIAKQANISLRNEIKYHGLYAAAHLYHRSVHLLIPITFMNLSGRSVQALMHYHKLTPEQILIAHDDIDLPVGTIRLKFDGGDGGHNGLKDVIQHLHTKKFYRLRIGVGRPPHKEVVDYVLEAPSKADYQKIMTALENLNPIIEMILAGQMQQAMQQLHTNQAE